MPAGQDMGRRRCRPQRGIPAPARFKARIPGARTSCLAHLVRLQGPNLVTIGTRDGTQTVRTDHSHRDRAVMAARPPRDARHRHARLDTAAAAEILDAAARGEAAKTAGEATSMIVTRRRAGFRSVLCPIDFSEHSRRALEYGAAVALDARAALHDARPVAAVDGAGAGDSPPRASATIAPAAPVTRHLGPCPPSPNRP